MSAQAFLVRTLPFLAGATLALSAPPALAGTTGTIRGVVVDADTLQPVAGATVIALSPSLQGEEATLTDDLGRYRLSALPPGTYLLRFVYAGATAERTSIVVSVDKTVTINADLSSAAVVAEVYTIEKKAPSVDTGSSVLGVTVTEDFVRNVPQGRNRNFEATMDVLPSASGDEYGTSVGGATSPENSYLIDGLNTTNPAYGLVGSRLVLDFIEEFDLKEGGYGAEFGRATGALVNIVTKSGSNEFHGSIFLYARPGFLEANRRLVARAGEAIGSTSGTDYYMNPGFELGGPIMKDKLWFHVGYAPELQADRWTRTINARRAGEDTDGDGFGDGPALDVNGDVITEEVGKEELTSMAIVHQFTGKLTHLIDGSSRHSLTFRGAPSTFEGVRENPFDPNSPVVALEGTPETYNFRQRHGSLDGVYEYNGEFFDDKLEIEGWLGWHHEESIYNPSSGNDDVPLIAYQYPRNLRDFEQNLPSACAVDQDLGDGMSRCLVEGYNVGGFGQGLRETIILDRWAERLAGKYTFEFAGLHQIKVGLDFEQNRYKNRRSYTGQGFYLSEPDGYFEGQQYFANGETDVIAKDLATRTETFNYALFAQDTWNPMPNLTINYGLRWEAQELTGIDYDNPGETVLKMGIYDNLAPRIGAVWDFLGDGRSRLFGHFGRFYESIPLDLNDRGFGGEGIRLGIYDATGDYSGERCVDANGTVLPQDAVTDPATQCTEFESYAFGGEDELIAPGLKGQYSDEFILGAELEVWPSWVVGLTGIYRNLGRVIEDVSTDGGDTYIIANPGDFDSGAIEEISRQIAKEPDPRRRAELELFRDQAEAINGFDRPRREFFGIQLTVDKKLSSHFLVRGSYLLSWLSGNYPGLYSDHNLQIDPNITTQYDLPELLTNRDGYLSADRRHRIKADGYYTWLLRELGVDIPIEATLGASVRIESGKPIEVLGADPIYGVDESFILPRGTIGRTPWTWSADVHLGALYDLGSEMGVEIFIDMFNVTNNQTATDVDQTYTTMDVNAVRGGTAADLAHLRDTDGDPIRKNPNYKKPIRYQAPFSAQLGARFTF